MAARVTQNAGRPSRGSTASGILTLHAHTNASIGPARQKQKTEPRVRGVVAGCAHPHDPAQQPAPLHRAPINTQHGMRRLRDAQKSELAEPLERATRDGGDQVILQDPVSAP